MWPDEVASADQCAVCFSIRDVPDPVMCEKVDQTLVLKHLAKIDSVKKPFI